jgi:hypothetical protein
MSGLVKIGRTNDINRRPEELYSTGVPTPFVLEFHAFVDDCEKLERTLHRIFNSHRLSGKREFFRLELKPIVKEILKLYPTAEVFDREEHEEIARQEILQE